MSTASVLRILGGSRVVRQAVNNKIDLLRLSRRGITKAAVLRLAESLALSLKDIALLIQVSERNLLRYADSERLSAAVSGRVLQLAEVAARGEEVFASREQFRLWLGEQSVAFGGMRPVDMLDTVVGTQMVMEELGRLEHGVYA